jgi:hypothetical protein
MGGLREEKKTGAFTKTEQIWKSAIPRKSIPRMFDNIIAGSSKLWWTVVILTNPLWYQTYGLIKISLSLRTLSTQ